MYDNHPPKENHLVTRNDPRVVSFLETITRLDKGLDDLTGNCRPSLSRERYLTDKQLSEWLHISRCTLLEYRNAGFLPYYLLGGKILYKKSEIDKLLKDNFYGIIP